MSTELEGKVALVTGAARGQGAAHARCLAEHGAAVLCTDIRDELGEAVAESINSIGQKAVYRHLDVRSTEGWGNAVESAEETFGRLDILVNNAGIVAVSGAEDCTDQEWEDVVGTNQTGPFKGTRAALPALRRAGGGSIINTSSVYGLKGVWGYAAYVSAKAALIGLTRSTAIQFSPENIRANAICPSAVNTPMLEEELAHFEDDPYFDWDEWLREKPIPRVAEPEEISELVLYLASDRSRFVTGSVLAIDGGLTA